MVLADPQVVISRAYNNVVQVVSLEAVSSLTRVLGCQLSPLRSLRPLSAKEHTHHTPDTHHQTDEQTVEHTDEHIDEHCN